MQLCDAHVKVKRSAAGNIPTCRLQGQVREEENENEEPAPSTFG